MGGILLEAAAGGAIAHGGADQGGPIMIRADQVKAAIKIIGPADREACEKLLKTALDFIDMDAADSQREKDVASKDARKALAAYRAVLARARVAHQKLPAGMKQCLAMLGRINGDPAHRFDDHIANCDRTLDVPREYPFDFVKLSAAGWASYVLQNLDMKTSATRGGKWVKLAAILYAGDKSIDMLHHCRQWKQRRSAPEEPGEPWTYSRSKIIPA
jgi:hypothetical protein